MPGFPARKRHKHSSLSGHGAAAHDRHPRQCARGKVCRLPFLDCGLQSLSRQVGIEQACEFLSQCITWTRRRRRKPFALLHRARSHQALAQRLITDRFPSVRCIPPPLDIACGSSHRLCQPGLPVVILCQYRLCVSHPCHLVRSEPALHALDGTDVQHDKYRFCRDLTGYVVSIRGSLGENRLQTFVDFGYSQQRR